jgi:hypothetical protein
VQDGGRDQNLAEKTVEKLGFLNEHEVIQRRGIGDDDHAAGGA